MVSILPHQSKHQNSMLLPCSYVNEMIFWLIFVNYKAEKKGATPVAVGGIIGAASLWMAVLSPVMGIIVSMKL